MFKTILQRGLLVVTVILLAGSCSKEQKGTSRGTLTVASEVDLTTLDPIRAQEPYTLRVIGQIFEGLVALDGRGKLEPALAEKWTSNETHDRWRFTIRKGVHFHRDDVFGANKTREVSAEDVVFSFQRVLSKESYPAFALGDIVDGVTEYQAGKTKEVSGIRVVDTGEVEFALTHPEPLFLHRITSPWFVVYPKEIVDLGPDVLGREKAIGTGPFRLVKRTDTEVTMDRNTNYWGKVSGNVKTLVFKVIKNDQIRLTELQNGNIDIMRLPLALIPAVAGVSRANGESLSLNSPWEGTFAVKSLATFNSHLLGFNTSKLDEHLRRAINSAINRKEIVQAITYGTASPSVGTVPTALSGYEPPKVGDLYDPAKAKEELAKSSFNPTSDSLEMLVHEKESSEQVGELIQSQLKQIGVNVRLTKLDYNTVIGRLVKGDFSTFIMSFEYVFSTPGPILNNLFNSQKIPVPNFWRYNNPQVDANLAKFQTVPDQAAANSLAQIIERQLIDDPPAAFLFEVRTPIMFRRELSGVGYNGHSIPLLWEVKCPQ